MGPRTAHIQFWAHTQFSLKKMKNFEYILELIESLLKDKAGDFISN